MTVWSKGYAVICFYMSYCGGRVIKFSLPSFFFALKFILLRFYTGLLTDFTTKTYNIGVLKRKVQKLNVKGDIDYEKDY